jgi:hypothetical protein
LPLGRDLLHDRLLSDIFYAVRVAGLVVSVSGRPGPSPLTCAGRARGFLVDAATPDLRLDVAWRELDGPPPGPPLFDSGGVWRAYGAAAGSPAALCLRFHDARLAFPYKEASIDEDGRHGTVWLDPRAFTSGEAVDPLEHPLDELLFQRLLDRRPLDAGGGLELHAVGVVAPSGHGYLFAGQSGDGKTTTARLWQRETGATILSDDRIVLTRGGAGGWRMHGTPWHGEAELAAPASAPLSGAFVLARGTRCALEPLAPTHAVAALLARSFPAFYDAAATARLVERLGRLVAEVPCRRFPFVPGPAAVRHVIDHAP